MADIMGANVLNSSAAAAAAAAATARYLLIRSTLAVWMKPPRVSCLKHTPPQ